MTALGVGVACWLPRAGPWRGWVCVRRRRVALVGSMVLSACPALLAGTLRFPTVLLSSGSALTVGDAATASGTFAVLGWFAAPACWCSWRCSG